MIDKPYKQNKLFNFDETLISDFLTESNITIRNPLGGFQLSIRLQDEQSPCIYELAPAGIICRYILKDYMKEDYDAFLFSIFDKLRAYGKFIDFNMFNFAKRSTILTLADNYKSIKDISCLNFNYDVGMRNLTRDTDGNLVAFTIDTDIKIVFDGESYYDCVAINHKHFSERQQMIINYHDVDGFIFKFVEFYNKKFVDKLGIIEAADSNDVITLVDMLIA
jgi:hypothetical protein